MNNLVKYTTSTLLLLTSGAYASVPNVFSSNTPAVAADVNENFEYLAEKSIGVNLVNGEISVEVDCSGNAAALNETYADYVNYREINFFIKGNCYGDIKVRRDFDNDNNWLGKSYQVAGQTIHISPQSNETAGLIPNDLTGKVVIWATIGGGLYLSNLTIQLGNDWDYGVAFSRNGHGSVNNVTIKGPENANGAAIWIQEGAQAYISDLTSSGTTFGIVGQNGGTIRLLGSETDIVSINDAVRLTGSSLRQSGVVNAHSTNGAAIRMQNGAKWFAEEKTIETNGSVRLTGNSVLNVDTINGNNSEILADSATLIVNNLNGKSANFTNTNFYGGHISMPSGHLHIQGSNIDAARLDADSVYFQSASAIFSNGNIANSFDVTRNSYVVIRNETTLNNIWIEKNSTLEGNSIVVTNLGAAYNSTVDLKNSTINSGLATHSNTTLKLSNTAFNGDDASFSRSIVEIEGENKIATSKMTCSGITKIHYEGVNDFLSANPDSQCLDSLAELTLINVIKSNHLSN